MRRAAKVDANHAEVVKALRKIGVMVIDTSGAGSGFPDLVCISRGVVTLVEIKDGSKPPSARKLTPDQVKLHDEAAAHGARPSVVTSVEEALALFKGI